MKSLNKNAVIALIFLTLLIACRKKENLDYTEPLGLGGDTWSQSAIDKYIYDTLTKPYNIAVNYKWNPWELQLDRTLVPPMENKIVPALSVVKKIWIDTYNAELGSDMFIKKYAPKEIYLVGSPQYNYNGTIVLGQAEGGRKITLFVINEFDQKNIPQIREMMHTIEHEFAHILHQNVMYPLEYQNITPQYTSTWFNVATATAQSQGFITAYSMSNPDDDFVEMVSTMLVEGKTRYEELLTSLSTTAQSLIRKKEAIVVSYFKQVWNIDFYRLQQRVQDAINNISPDPNVNDVYGFGKKYTTVSVNPANTLLTQQAGFTTIYNTAKTGLAAVGGAGRVLDSFAVVQNSATTALLRVYYHNTALTALQANFTYNVSKDVNNVYTYTYVGADANGGVVGSGLTALLNFFSTNTFKVDWLLSPNNTIRPLRAIFTPQTTANSAFMGLLLP